MCSSEAFWLVWKSNPSRHERHSVLGHCGCAVVGYLRVHGATQACHSISTSFEKTAAWSMEGRTPHSAQECNSRRHVGNPVALHGWPIMGCRRFVSSRTHSIDDMEARNQSFPGIAGYWWPCSFVGEASPLHQQSGSECNRLRFAGL
jgi:hypothetical protein